MAILSAIGIGVAVLLGGNLPWSGLGALPGLASLNLRHSTAVPWAIIPMAAYLIAYWQVVSGRWPRSPERRADLRANSVSARIWPAALASGLLGFGALLAFVNVLGRLVTLPESAPIEIPGGMPTPTAFALLTMGSIVAGVSEEAAFRGYMQTSIERTHGLTIAILVSGAMFGLLHFPNHPRDVLTMLPYYIAVSAVYGGLTWAADSILPALVLHVAGDVFSLTRLWVTGRPEWDLGGAPSPLAGGGHATTAFISAIVALALLTALTVAAYAGVRRMRVGEAKAGGFR